MLSILNVIKLENGLQNFITVVLLPEKITRQQQQHKKAKHIKFFTEPGMEPGTSDTSGFSLEYNNKTHE